MLLYLRIVYSFDYYSTVEYPHEDAMPHRCGIFHSRGPQPKGRVVQRDCKFSASYLSFTKSRLLKAVIVIVAVITVTARHTLDLK